VATAACLEGGDLLWLLGSLCQIGRMPFDPALVSQEYPPPLTTVTLHQAARALGFRTGEHHADAAVLPGLTFPAIAFLHPVPHAAPRGAGAPTQLHVVRESEQAELPASPMRHPRAYSRISFSASAQAPISPNPYRSPSMSFIRIDPHPHRQGRFTLHRGIGTEGD